MPESTTKKTSAPRTKISPPIVPRMDARIATLQRRLDYLDHKLSSGSYASTAAADYDRAEREAITEALRCMEYVRELVQ